MIIEETFLPEVFVITNTRYGDERGWFSEVFRQNQFDFNVLNTSFVQINESYSSHNILRGIHYQNPFPQGKLVRVVSGEVFDVAVDLRKSSPYFGKWIGVTLSKENGKQLWIPEGFGHGFLVTGDHAHFVYHCTNYYNVDCECCLKYDDPSVNIDWPISGEVIISEKDKKGLYLNQLKLFK